MSIKLSPCPCGNKDTKWSGTEVDEMHCPKCGKRTVCAEWPKEIHQPDGSPLSSNPEYVRLSEIEAARQDGYAKGLDDAYATMKRESVCHEWKSEPDVKTTSIQCLLCEDEAVVIVHAPHGCLCSPNKYQPRCMQHLMRANDTDEDITVIEDFRIPLTQTEGGAK